MLSAPQEDGVSIDAASRQSFADFPAIPAERTASTSTRRRGGADINTTGLDGVLGCLAPGGYLPQTRSRQGLHPTSYLRT
jgi:hypothetical protein